MQWAADITCLLDIAVEPHIIWSYIPYNLSTKIPNHEYFHSAISFPPTILWCLASFILPQVSVALKMLAVSTLFISLCAKVSFSVNNKQNIKNNFKRNILAENCLLSTKSFNYTMKRRMRKISFYIFHIV